MKDWIRFGAIISITLIAAACAPASPTQVPAWPTASYASPATVAPTEAATSTAEPAATEAAPPVTTPVSEAATRAMAVTAPEIGLTMELPDGWERVGDKAFWSPAGDAGYGIGAARETLQPPMEAEAVLLPMPSQVLDSQPATTPWGDGHRVTLLVYEEAIEGEGQAAVAALERHVMVVRVGEDGRDATDIYARAADEEALVALDSILAAAVASATWSEMEPVAADWGQPSERVIEAIGMRFMLPDGFQGRPSDLEGQHAYAFRDDPNLQAGVQWVRLEPPMEPEAVLLPTPSRVLKSEPMTLPWGEGRLVTLELLGPADEGEVAPVVGASKHLLVVRADEDGRLGVSIYLRAPELDMLEAHIDLLHGMVETVSFEP